jgi:phosphotransferase system IIA component
MYTLKSIFKRGALLSAAGAMLVAAILPASAAFADELNPLTERSLLLSSSAPGYTDTDGSGNATFAGPGTGPNGKQTGEVFSFKVSTDSTIGPRPIKAFTLQYCTGAAGKCQAPGDNTGDARDSLPTAREDNDTANPLNRSDFDVVGPWATEGALAGQFQVLVNNVATTGWTMTTTNVEDTSHSENLTGKKNYILLTNATGVQPTSGQQVKLVFKASAANYIQNPGSGSFFVKINTYDSDTVQLNAQNDPTPLVTDDQTTIDGGVTVANVMTDSIHITTKVLETMAFSVGTRNRDNVVLNCAGYPSPATIAAGCEAVSGAAHGTCDAVQNVNNNRLNLGDPNAEYSLETGKGWSVDSYWRLSSNSSGGATVYYSGNTLANTVGDEISDVPTETISTPGTEQFGLGFVDAARDTKATDFVGGNPSSKPFLTLKNTIAGNSDQTDPEDFPAGQTASAEYDEAEGTLNGANGAAGTAKFKFLKSSLAIPEMIAQQNDKVVSCATAKMRYVGNIAADTPAGVYTTKINYLAAPQY